MEFNAELYFNEKRWFLQWEVLQFSVFRLYFLKGR